MSSLVLITAPTAEPVTVEDMKTHTRVDFEHDDDLMDNYLKAARQKLDGRDGWLGRAIETQKWRLNLDSFPAEIVVPLPPCQSIDSITYVDTEGDTQTLAASSYIVSGIGAARHAIVTPVTSWPATKARREAVSVNFTAGYEIVPEPIKQAIRLWAAHLYEEREAVVVAGSMREMPLGVDELIADYRVRTF